MLGLLLGFCVVIGLSAMAADAPKKGKLRHVVAFKFKESASKADIMTMRLVGSVASEQEAK